jgi:hypothetical protein
VRGVLRSFLTVGKQISDFRRGLVQVFVLLGCYAAQVSNCLSKFLDSLSVPIFFGTSVNCYGRTLRNVPEERRFELVTREGAGFLFELRTNV